MTRPIVAIATSLILLLLCSGCKKPVAPSTKGNEPITSDVTIIVENGEITKRRPAVTEDVERAIYKSLNGQTSIQVRAY